MYKVVLFLYLLVAQAQAETTYEIALASPAPWLKISQLLYNEIAKNIPNTKFQVFKIPSKRAIGDLEKKSFDGEVGWVKSNLKSDSVIATNTPIVELYFVLITKNKKLFQNKEWKDLKGLKIGYPRGAHYINHKLHDSSRYELNRLEQAVELLKAGRIDGVVTSYQNYKNRIKDPSLKVMRQFTYKVKLYPIFHKSHLKLRNSVDRSLKIMRETGVYNQIFKKTGFMLIEKKAPQEVRQKFLKFKLYADSNRSI